MRCFSAENKIRLAWFNLALVAVGCPLSLFLVDEPPVILVLSWYAIFVGALADLSASKAQAAGEN